MDKKHINSIQALRAFAALSVVIFHYHDFLPFDADSVIGHFVFHGYFGVDMFFVISGFIAYYTVNNIDRNEPNLALCYFIKRLARVIPLYYILTIISSNHTHEGFIQTAKSLAFIPSDLAYAGPSYGLPTVMQGWTLNYEMYFYLIVTFSFLFGKFKWFFVFTFIFMVISLPIILFGYPQKKLWLRRFLFQTVISEFSNKSN